VKEQRRHERSEYVRRRACRRDSHGGEVGLGGCRGGLERGSSAWFDPCWRFGTIQPNVSRTPPCDAMAPVPSASSSSCHSRQLALSAVHRFTTLHPGETQRSFGASSGSRPTRSSA
jgi:hypothetical protein